MCLLIAIVGNGRRCTLAGAGGCAVEACVLIEAVGDDDGALEDLLKWLTQQDELRGRVHPVSGTFAPGSMSGAGVTEVLAVAVGAGGMGTVLAQALVVWCRHPRGSKVRVRLISPDGTRTEVDGDRLTDVQNVIKAAVESHDRVSSGHTGADAALEGGIA
ncbi:hypothetical protein ACIP10_34905 [Streptomyces galbus]|uniref:effector-associated constant component EACC1 n=1 Tax=Streptomyces galbus TaxID=33898 RepID=UPI0037FD163A